MGKRRKRVGRREAERTIALANRLKRVRAAVPGGKHFARVKR